MAAVVTPRPPGSPALKLVDLMRGTDAESMFVWMDNFCQQNALKTVPDGAEVLEKELLKLN